MKLLIVEINECEKCYYLSDSGMFCDHPDFMPRFLNSSLTRFKMPDFCPLPTITEGPDE